MDCPYCFKDSAINVSSADELSLGQFKEVLQKIKKAHPTRVLLTGGEPFLRKDLTEIIKELFLNKLNVAIATNGTLYNSDVFKLLKNNAKSIHFIQVSIDGHCPEINDKTRGNGSFDKTVLFIKELKNINIKVECRVTLQKYNISFVREIYSFLKNILNINLITFNELRNIGRASDGSDMIMDDNDHIRLYRSFIELINDRKAKFNIRDCEVSKMIMLSKNNYNHIIGGKLRACVAAYKGIHILHNGNIVPCDFMNKFIIGNIRDINDLVDFWKESPMLNMLRTRVNLSLNSFEKCKNCDFITVCIGGCPVNDYFQTNTITSNYNNNCLKEVYEKYKDIL
jgi:SynChlorMet cassette radical SAM/SPASM protein ScmE